MKSANKITYESFTERVANRAKVSNAEANSYIHQFSETASKALEGGDEVQLYRFGRFVTTHVDEHAGHNPGTGEAIIIPDHTRVDFHPYQALLDAVNWPFRHLRNRMLSDEETDSRPGIFFWVLLLIALLALIMFGFAINNWMSSQNNELTSSEALAMSMEQAIVQAETVVNEEVPVRTEVAAIAAAESGAVAARTTHIVVARGDTLWGIAAAQWEDSSWWPVIYAENRVDLTQRNPDLIETGSLLRLPVLAGSVAQPTEADLRQKTIAYQIVADDYTRLVNKRAADYRYIAERGF